MKENCHKKIWAKTQIAGLRRSVPTGMCYLHKKVFGAVVDVCLETDDLVAAKVRFADRVSKLTKAPPEPKADPLTKATQLVFRDLFAIYLNRLKAGAYGDLDAKTIEKRDYLIRTLKSSWGSVPGFIRNKRTELAQLAPAEVSYDDLLAWRKHFLAPAQPDDDYDPEEAPGLGYSADYFNKTLQVVRDLFELAIEREQITDNPVSRIKPAPVQRETYLLPTSEQFAVILNYNSERTASFKGQNRGVFMPRVGQEVSWREKWA